MKANVLFSTFILTLVIGFILSGCQSEKKECSEVAEQFLTAYFNDDFETALPLGTFSTTQLVEHKRYIREMNPYTEEEGKVAIAITKIDFLSKNTKAVVHYSSDGRGRLLHMSKLEGKWVVDMNEENPIEAQVAFSNKPDGSGYASAESDPIRMGDLK